MKTIFIFVFIGCVLIFLVNAISTSTQQVTTPTATRPVTTTTVNCGDTWNLCLSFTSLCKISPMNIICKKTCKYC